MRAFNRPEGGLDAARELVDQAKDGRAVPLPRRPALFRDHSLRSYDPDATALLIQRVLDFVRAR
jgi:hypothetical protein